MRHLSRRSPLLAANYEMYEDLKEGNKFFRLTLYPASADDSSAQETLVEQALT